MTDIILHGAKPRCPAAGSRAKKAGISAKRKRKRGRATLGQGRSRPLPHPRRQQRRHDPRHQVAHHRERCAGTATRVFEGAVVVRNRHTGKRVTVRAGKRYLARRKR